jgi:type II secretory pathway component PulK
VLWVIVIVSAITSTIVLATRSNSEITANYRAGVVARYAAESGVSVAVAALQDSLAQLGMSPARRSYLNALDRALGRNVNIELNDARIGIRLIDVGSLLDVNWADVTSLTRLFSYFTDTNEAESTARAIRAYMQASSDQGLQAARALESVDELARVPGVSQKLLDAASAFLTVDGDGTINRMTASDTVLTSAAGGLGNEPTRILVVSRGWQDGHALTHEIQAVYALNGSQLTLVRWRERDL